MDGGETPPPVADRFLKILQPGFETASKLPPAFSRMLNNTDLDSKTVVLKSCKGSWEIDVKKCDYGCVHFLGKKWEGYVSDHNLKEGDSIVFEHNGHLHFNTDMFDKSGCVKDFTFVEEKEEESTSEDDDDDEFFEEESSSEDEMDEEDDDDEPIEGNYRSTADKIANSSRFQIPIAKWTFNKGWTRVPNQFAISNDMMQNKTVKLRNGTGNSWLAKLQVKNTTVAKKRVVLTGLVKFFKENKLEIGDKCTFKLAQPSRSSRDQHVVMDVVFQRRKGEEHNPGRLIQDSRSQYQLTLVKWNFTHYYLYVPMSFARLNDMMQDRTVKLQNGTGDTWLVKLFVSRTKKANRAPREQVLLTSLGVFMKDNDLKVGDTCIFKLVQPSTRQEHVVMDVAFVRGRQQ